MCVRRAAVRRDRVETGVQLCGGLTVEYVSLNLEMALCETGRHDS